MSAKWRRKRIGLRIQFMAVHQRHTVGAAQPKVPGRILENLVDGIAGQAVRGCEVRQFARAQPVQSVVAGAKPQAAVRILVDRPHLHLRQRRDRGVA